MRKAWLHLRDVLLAPPDHRLFQRSLFAGAISVCGALASLFLALGVLALLGVAPDELESVDPGSGWRLFFGAVVIAPVVESLLLGGTLWLMPERWSIPARALVAGIGLGLLHGLFAPFWFFGTWFPFFVFACGWMTWRQRSFRHALAAAALPHAVQNLLACCIVAVSG